jgi:3-hydroxyisobutyrate dehydrogenase-like beta-hydroxyacid dehydrogenase
MTVVAVLGMGEAGRAIATDLVAAGLAVCGYDPVVCVDLPCPVAPSVAGAVSGADAVFSVNAAAVAEAVAAEALPAMPATGLYADLNTAAPALKVRLAQRAAGLGRDFADVALMSPVPGRGLATPALVAGTGATRYARLLRGCGDGFGARVTVLAEPAGTAAARKLLRSVFMKGLAAAVLETLAAARAAGCEQWAREELAGQFGADLVERLETGSHRHAARRVDELAAAGEMLTDLGVSPLITDAARERLLGLARRGA